VIIDEQLINIEIADEVEEHWQGLSDRKSMSANNGMLFKFPNYQIRTFVMRNMHFPLDIIFIKDNKIVKIYERLEPEGVNPVKRYTSPIPMNYVLEVNGGYCDAFGIKEGDQVKINLE